MKVSSGCTSRSVDDGIVPPLAEGDTIAQYATAELPRVESYLISKPLAQGDIAANLWATTQFAFRSPLELTHSLA